MPGMHTAERFPRMIFFDVGETLIRPRKPYGDLLQEIALDTGVVLPKAAVDGLAIHIDRRVTERTQRGMPFTFPLEESQRFWFDTYHVFFRAFLNPHDADRLATAFLSLLSSPKGYALYADTLVTLECLLRRGYRLGIISNWEMWLPALLAAVGIDHLFDLVVISGECGVEKPDERIFLRALANTGYHAEEVVYIGDRPAHDVEPARKAGIRPILLDRYARYPPDDRHHTITSLHDLVFVLEDARGLRRLLA